MGLKKLIGTALLLAITMHFAAGVGAGESALFMAQQFAEI